MTGNTSEDVDAARVYGNFLLYSGILHRPNLTATVPSKMLSGSGATVQAQRCGHRGDSSLHLQMDIVLRRHIRQSQCSNHHIHGPCCDSRHPMHSHG